MANTKYLIIIGGPTASGKTGVAIQLAQHYNCPILSCDSRQFYKEMTIGTAKPNTEELAAAPHFFINNLSIHDKYSVGHFERDALECLDKIYQKSDVAIMAGGTGLYIKAVCEGLDTFPDVDPSVKEAVQLLFDSEGIVPLQEELKKTDLAYYDSVDLNNYHRLIRALSVIRSTGKPFSHFRTSVKKERPFTPIYINLNIDRAYLYERINLRVDLMLEKGLMQEIECLYPFKHLNALQTVGYKEFFDAKDGKYSFEEAVELVKRNSRRYAKRQMTWFRRADHWTVFHPKQVKEMIDFVSSKIEK